MVSSPYGIPWVYGCACGRHSVSHFSGEEIQPVLLSCRRDETMGVSRYRVCGIAEAADGPQAVDRSNEASDAGGGKRWPPAECGNAPDSMRPRTRGASCWKMIHALSRSPVSVI